MFLAYAINKKFKFCQADVKLDFLNEELEEEVYIEQLEGSPVKEEKDMVYRLKKALYGLKQAPRIWYARLGIYLEKLGFSKGTIDSNLYLKEIENGLLIIVIFVDDIIFVCNDKSRDKFDMSTIGKMNFFSYDCKLCGIVMVFLFYKLST